MARITVAPDRLPAVMAEADRIANRLTELLSQEQVDLNEAKKAIQFYVYSGADAALLDRYLAHMAREGPVRSKRTRTSYGKLLSLWRESGRKLSAEEKGYAWAWAVRLAQSARSGKRG